MTEFVEWTGERRELRHTAARLFADAAEKDRLPPEWGRLPVGLNRPLWAALAELGLLGLAVPEGSGGAGGELLDVCVVAEQAGTALAAVPFVGTVAVTSVLAAADRSGSVLGPVLAGERVVVPAWSSFPASVVPGRRDSLTVTGATVRGELTVPFGLDADQLLGFAPDGRPLLVELAGPGVRRVPATALDVMEPLATVSLLDAPATLLAPLDLPVSRLLTVFAAELIGTGQRALDGAVEYAKQRRQFGRPIGSFQTIKHLLADRYVQLDAARLLVFGTAAEAGRSGNPGELGARTALAAASAAAEAAAADALQVHGGIGFTWEHLSHLLLKRARSRRTLLGAPATQLATLATHLYAETDTSAL